MAETVKTHLWLIGAGTILSGFSLASIVAFTNPNSAGKITHFLFFLSLFLFALGLFSLIGIMVRQHLRSGLYILHLAVSFRQALLLSIFITISLLLSTAGLLFWWIETLLILFLIATEIFLNL